MLCKCGLPIDKAQAAEDMYVCSCGCCWEIINDILRYSGTREVMVDIGTGAVLYAEKVRELEENPQCPLCKLGVPRRRA